MNLASFFFPQSFWDNYLKFNDYKENFSKFSFKCQCLNCSNLSVTSNRPTLPISGSSCDLPNPRICKLRLVQKSNRREGNSGRRHGVWNDSLLLSQKKGKEVSFFKENKTFMEIPYTELAEIQQGIKSIQNVSLFSSSLAAKL